MKQVLLLIFSAYFCYGLSAQQSMFEVFPNPAAASITVDWSSLYETQTCYAQIKNTSNREKTLRWVLEVVNAPTGWKFFVCDKNDCYHSFNSTNVNLPSGYPNAPVALMAGDTSRLLVNALPAGRPGIAEVRIHLYDMSNPTAIVSTAGFKISISEAEPLTEADRSQLRIFPNPVSDYMTLSGNTFVRQLRVSNILGKQLKTFDTTPQSRYDISDLPDGMYLVNMVDANNKVVKTVRVVKREMRP